MTVRLLKLWYIHIRVKLRSFYSNVITKRKYILTKKCIICVLGLLVATAFIE
jgi:hypothetical protein